MAPLEKLRKAIIADVAEDGGVIGELCLSHEDLVEAWNEVAETEQVRGVNLATITDADIEAGMQ